MDWTPDLSVGVMMIDEQHKELFRRINSFRESVRNGSGKDKVLEVVKYLESYVITHFKDEEDLQIRYCYPGFIPHKKLHMEFVQTVKRIRADVEKGVTLATQSMVSITLSTWLMMHINKEDKALGEYIRSKSQTQ